MGLYEHPAYMKINLIKVDDKITFEYENRQLELRHLNGNTYEGFDSFGYICLTLTFCADEKGKVNAVTSPLEPTVKDIVFIRVK